MCIRDSRYPDTEFECLIGEEEDVIDLLQKNRAHIGLIEARKSYPPDISAARLSKQTEMAIYAAPTHPLAQRERIRPEELDAVRELRLSTYLERDQARVHGVIWSAPNYLLLLSMAVQGQMCIRDRCTDGRPREDNMNIGKRTASGFEEIGCVIKGRDTVG